MSNHVVTLRGGPADGQQIRVPTNLTEIALVENRMSNMPAMGSETAVPNKVTKHAYAMATVVQGHTIVYEFFYRGEMNE